ncbi:PAP2 superfamily protein [Burkholderia oklahomensis]|uniref:PAP2 superfamily protein n=1 Tax=Burkholderia oklahomensis TaxID=342113 RepID=A0AAI8B578_9BURK|nr:PAP2 superfamily protein [Burkholderia oklahomensis]AOI42849.1 phosphatidic acid phosphatase [Burkholderia oklahomensis EO147]KUY58610.1 phosphatidic acid phosphatase [Burkholderia oklahomensis EO147]
MPVRARRRRSPDDSENVRHAQSDWRALAFAFAYDSAKRQLIGITIGLGLTGRDEALPEFVTLFMLAGMLVLLISASFPAASAFLHFRVPDPAALSSVSDFVRLRDGTLHAFDPAARQGTVSMPSFHTVLGVPFAYALRRVSVVAPLALLFNGWMVAPTPTQGGHDLVDVLSGLLVAFAGIVALRYICERREPRRRPRGVRCAQAACGRRAAGRWRHGTRTARRARIRIERRRLSRTRAERLHCFCRIRLLSQMTADARI